VNVFTLYLAFLGVRHFPPFFPPIRVFFPLHGDFLAFFDFGDFLAFFDFGDFLAFFDFGDFLAFFDFGDFLAFFDFGDLRGDLDFFDFGDFPFFGLLSFEHFFPFFAQALAYSSRAFKYNARPSSPEFKATKRLPNFRDFRAAPTDFAHRFFLPAATLPLRL